MNMKLANRNIIVLAVLIMFFVTYTGSTAIANGSSNSYSPTVAQEFYSNSEDASRTFTYKIEKIQQDARSSQSTFTITGNDSVKLDPLEFSGPGTYEYEVFQVVNAPKQGYTYDRQIYTIRVRVDNSRETEIIIKNEDDIKVDAILFVNRYELQSTDPKLMADPPVRKTVTGEPEQPGIFTFRLVAKNASQPMPAGSANGMKSVQVTGNGEAEFGTWSYHDTGTYFYTVTEVNTGVSGYVYDTTVYTITDTVSELNGSLILSRIVTNMANKQVPAMSFINKYTGATGPSSPSNPSGPSGPGAGPKTGDDTNITIYVILLALGSAMTGAALVFLIIGGKKKEQKRCDHNE
jgi:pilin isopeptide linkage protein